MDCIMLVFLQVQEAMAYSLSSEWIPNGFMLPPEKKKSKAGLILY